MVAWMVLAALVIVALFGFIMAFRDLLSGAYWKVAIIGGIALAGGIKTGRIVYQTAKQRQNAATSDNV